MRLPKPISNLINNFERLPGIGPKTAQRLTFYLLRFPQDELEKFAEALVKLKADTKICSVCRNVGESDPCEICSDESRIRNVVAVVSSPLDVFALERARFKGLYHVLHGLIDPLNNIGPEEIFIDDLLKRIKGAKSPSSDWTDYIDDKSDETSGGGEEISEIILATNTSMEGESTAMYIQKMIRNMGYGEDRIKITRIARGLPVGGDIEYADDTTLFRALEGRSEFRN